MMLAFCAGGTGGHIYPALAVAQSLPEAQVLFVGSDQRLEAQLVQAHGHAFYGFPIRRGHPGSWVSACGPVMRLFQEKKVTALLCFGGYVCLAAFIAAHMLDIPVILHEQNKVLGRFNRALAPWARRLCLSFPDTRGAERLMHQTVTGCPVRLTESAVLQSPSSDEAWMSALDASQPLLLIMGGSQGAAFFNASVEWLLKNSAAFAGQILLITGQGEWPAFAGGQAQGTQVFCVSQGVLRIVAVPYVHAMENLLTRCRMFVARAGASTLAEMALYGIPGLVVPYPYATNFHQDANARHYQAGGSIAVLPQKGLLPDMLWKQLGQLWQDSEKLKGMASAMRSMACPDAAQRVLECFRSVGIHGINAQ